MTNPEPGPHGALPRQSFGPTSGVFSGWIGLALVVICAFFVIRDQEPMTALRWCGVLLVVGVLLWAYMLRPRVVIDAGGVLLRNAFKDWYLPWGAVESARVRAVTQVWASSRKYVGVAVGRNVRAAVRKRPRISRPDPTFDIVERLVNDRAGEGDDARPRASYAVPELVVLLVGVVLFAVSFA